jgi:hypothetical protein
MEGTDLNNTIDTYTLNNANYWDERTPYGFRFGTGSITAPATTAATQAVTFGTAFPAGATIRVLITISSTHTTNILTSTTALSNTGFTWRAYNGGASSQTVTMNWIAFRVA